MITSLTKKQESRALKVARNLDKLAESRSALLQNSEVLDGLSEVEIDVAHAGTKTPIASYDQDKLRTQLAIYCKNLCRDLGIRTWDNPDIMAMDTSRFYTFLVKHYKQFTMKEVQQAFELLSAGKLDEYLPVDRNGHPDKGHYQMFSVEFQTKVLNAYAKLKKAVWSKSYSLLPDRTEPTEEEKATYHRTFIDQIYRYFKTYVELGYMPTILGATIIMAEFEEQGIVSGVPKPENHNYERAFLKVMQSNIDQREKTKVKNAYDSEEKNDRLEVSAKNDAYSEKIKQVFDRIIESKLDIENVIKYRL
jgi:hypothetical protein